MSRLAVEFLVTTIEDKERNFGLHVTIEDNHWTQVGPTTVLEPRSGKWDSVPGAKIVRLSSDSGTFMVRLDGLRLDTVEVDDSGNCLIPAIGTSGRWKCILVV